MNNLYLNLNFYLIFKGIVFLFFLQCTSHISSNKNSNKLPVLNKDSIKIRDSFEINYKGDLNVFDVNVNEDILLLDYPKKIVIIFNLKSRAIQSIIDLNEPTLGFGNAIYSLCLGHKDNFIVTSNLGYYIFSIKGNFIHKIDHKILSGFRTFKGMLLEDFPELSIISFRNISDDFSRTPYELITDNILEKTNFLTWYSTNKFIDKKIVNYPESSTYFINNKYEFDFVYNSHMEMLYTYFNPIPEINVYSFADSFKSIYNQIDVSFINEYKNKSIPNSLLSMSNLINGKIVELYPTSENILIKFTTGIANSKISNLLKLKFTDQLKYISQNSTHGFALFDINKNSYNGIYFIDKISQGYLSYYSNNSLIIKKEVELSDKERFYIYKLNNSSN